MAKTPAPAPDEPTDDTTQEPIAESAPPAVDAPEPVAPPQQASAPTSAFFTPPPAFPGHGYRPMMRHRHTVCISAPALIATAVGAVVAALVLGFTAFAAGVSVGDHSGHARFERVTHVDPFGDGYGYDGPNLPGKLFGTQDGPQSQEAPVDPQAPNAPSAQAPNN